MPRGDKSKYTEKQERKADHVAESYESRGVPEKEAEKAGLGDRQEGERRRQEERVGARQVRKPCLLAQGRKARRQGIGFPFRRRAFRFGKEGGRDAQAQRRTAPSGDMTCRA